MKQNFLCLLLCCSHFLLFAHTDTTYKGIIWVKDLSWQQVKEKAKKENKYIFVDVFATWCGPCKEMDKRVYVNDSVGDFFNEKFISIKVQVDQTANDDESVKRWYDDAKAIERDFRVMSLPTFLFFSPEATLVHKSTGLKSVKAFCKDAAMALTPGQVYTDPYAEYDTLLTSYRDGRKNYQRMGYMIKSATALGDIKLADNLTAEYIQYLEHAPRKLLYTKDAMDFLNTIEVKSSSKIFSLFYPDGEKADGVAGMKGFSERMVHRVIMHEIVMPFLGIKLENRPISLDGKPYGAVEETEADWRMLYKRIRKKYSKIYAQRGVLNGKITWYEQKNNFPAYYAAYLEKLDRYGFDTIGAGSTFYPNVNTNCWFLFLRIEDELLLNRAAKWMKELIARFPENPAWIDTYANLLYKAGDKEKAISWEERALALAGEKQWQSHIEQFSEVLLKMHNNEPTW